MDEKQLGKLSQVLKKLVIPASVTKFGGYNGKNFDGMWEIDPDYKAINNENAPIMDNATKKKVVIVTPKGSAAENYAKKHKIKYKNDSKKLVVR